MKFEQDILKAQIASQLSQEASIEGTDINILIKSFEENLIGSYDKEMFLKSWSSDLQAKFPNGGWRTINGASVFINNGKVVAGLGGFNGMIDDYFSAKKEGGNKDSQSDSKKRGKMVFDHTKDVDEYAEKHGLKVSRPSYSKLTDKEGNEYYFSNKEKWENSKSTPMIFEKDDQPKEEEKKDKPVNERTQQEIHEAKQKIADTMPKPINKMTWEEFKPYGIEMAKQSAHSQPESYYERMAKNEHDWATKNDKSQYDVPEKQKIEKKGGLSSVEQQLFDNAKKRYSGISEQRTIEIRDKIVQADKGKTSNINAFAESLMYSDGENHVEDYFGDAKEEAKMAQRAIDGKSGYENAQRIVDLKIGGNLEAKAKELISQYELIKNKANQLGLESPSKQVLKTALSFSGQEMTLSQVIELLNKVKGGELAEVAEAIRNNFKNDSQTNTVTIDTFKEIAKKAKDPKDFEEKAKLSPRAKQVLKDSQRTFDSSNSLRQIELYDLVKKNIGIDKNGKEKIGMGLDEDMVAAGNEFLKKNEKAYNEAKELIQSRKDFKKEEGKTKATKDVSNIEKIALQQNKEMEDKIKSVSSSASVKEKLEGVKQISNKIDNISKQEIYNSKTNQYNFKLMEDMSDVLKNIDEKYLSKDQKNEIDELKDNLDTMVSVDTLLSAPNQSKKKRRYEYDHFLKEHDSLSEKMEVLTKRLKYESDDKGNYSPQEHGSLSSFEDEVENVQKFLGSIKKDYVSRQATELLNYKLF